MARLVRPVSFALSTAVLGIAAWYWLQYDTIYRAVDYSMYMDATRRWLGGGPFYLPQQLAGPYTLVPGDPLYPPVALLLFVPFTMVPAAAWWLVPLGLTAWGLWRLRPSPIVWPLLASTSWWWTASEKVVAGNPVIWVLAAECLACSFDWPGVFVLLKPSLFPFALMGAWRQSWWIALAAFVAISVPFLPMWPQWLSTVLNARTPSGPLYSVMEAPLLAMPIVAWLASPRHGPDLPRLFQTLRLRTSRARAVPKDA